MGDHSCNRAAGQLWVHREDIMDVQLELMYVNIRTYTLTCILFLRSITLYYTKYKKYTQTVQRITYIAACYYWQYPIQ